MRLTILIVTVLCFSCDMRRSSEKRFEANIGILLPADKTVLKDEYQDMLQDYAIIYEVELSVEANETFIEKLETLASGAVADKRCNWSWAENGFSYDCEKDRTTYSVAYDTAKRRVVYRELAD